MKYSLDGMMGNPMEALENLMEQAKEITTKGNITKAYEEEYELQMDYWLNEGYGYEMAEHYAREYATNAMFTTAIKTLKEMK